MADIVSTTDTLGGAPRIEGRRIGVHHVVTRVIDGDESPEQVAADYDLALADVYRALLYYYDHADEMRRIQAERRTVSEERSVVRGPDDLDGQTRSEPRHEATGRRTRPASNRFDASRRGTRYRSRR